MAISGPPFAADAASTHALAERAKNGRLGLAELISVAEVLKRIGQPQAAADLYKTWIAFNSEEPTAHLALFNFSVSLRETGDSAGAINALRDCLRRSPKFGAARINLGRTLEDNGKLSEAVEQWRRYASETEEITPERIGHKLMALQHIGRVLESAESLEAAEDALRQAMELRPDRTEAGQHWIALRQRQCKWPTLLPLEFASPKQVLAAMSPMSLAAYADDPMFQLAKAYRYNLSFVGRPEGGPVTLMPRTKPMKPFDRLRVGYVSSDLRDHAVGFALSEVLELHDKARVEVFAYAFGEERGVDATQARIKKAVDHWRDINALTDRHAAQAIADDRIDILIDVNGYTKHARTKIFAYRPAPVIVNWCGYPGTMGSPHHHYMIADATIVPPENEIFYSEKVMRIPCNQPIDRKRIIATQSPTRAEAALPEDAFIFASFNGMQKVTERCFGRWMWILSQTPGSVLWLLTGSDGANENLRSAAAQHGVDPARILFAPKAANPHHLARIGLADLLLDTLPYGAHSTAADALTMGLPILTLPGKSFASRFCASVVAAAGLDQLICANADDYVGKAVAFAKAPETLRRHRERLRRGRDSSVLRDLPRLVVTLEDCYARMQAEHERGRTPAPDLSNLDVYYDIGAELDLEAMETLDADAYRALYREKLAQWHADTPLQADARLWRGEETKPARLSA